MKFALGIEYDGRGWQGWQHQPGGGTLQDELEHALAQIASAPVATVCAGRTDTGVHALQQVVHFETAVERPLSAWVRGVNSHLAASMAVRWVQPVADDFHARFRAVARRYRYLLLNRPQRTGLWAGRVGWQHRPLDLVRMQAAAACLTGEHDFSSFRAAQCQARSPVRMLYEARIRQRGQMFIFDFAANAFLHHMIRNLVGSLVAVGKGEYPVDWLAELLAARDRRQAAPTFAPDGLYFVGPSYEACWGLPELPDGPELY